MLETKVAETTIPEEVLRSFSVGSGTLEISFRTDEDQEDFLKELADKIREMESIDVQIGNQKHTGYKINREDEYGVIGICDYIDKKKAMLTIRLKNDRAEDLLVRINDTNIEKNLFAYAHITRSYIDLVLRGRMEYKNDLKRIDKRIKSMENIDAISIGDNKFTGYCLGRVRGRCDFVNKKIARLDIKLSKTN